MMNGVAVARLVEVTEISKFFNGTPVVDGISLDVNPGEIFGLIGPNGAGKTTTIRMMMDIIKPDTGEVRILGEFPNEIQKTGSGICRRSGGYTRNRPSLKHWCT
jgi:ABC-2 type transport system ATP-binding protein